MAEEHEFGGRWTEKKLTALRKYLEAFRVIFDRNAHARNLKTVYVDAFAGTGTWMPPNSRDAREAELFDDAEKGEAGAIRLGSAAQALALESAFDRYVFIDENAAYLEELRRLVCNQYGSRLSLCEFIQGDANEELKRLTGPRGLDWNTWRGVLFLDPYSMSVAWDTIVAVANTRSIDTWILFPAGQALNRCVTRKRQPPAEFAAAIDRVLGECDWRDKFYRVEKPTDLFGTELDETHSKVVTVKHIGEYFLKRLSTVFAGVAPESGTLRNSRSSPLFELCFATGARKDSARDTAVRIAADLIKKLNRTN